MDALRRLAEPGWSLAGSRGPAALRRTAGALRRGARRRDSGGRSPTRLTRTPMRSCHHGRHRAGDRHKGRAGPRPGSDLCYGLYDFNRRQVCNCFSCPYLFMVLVRPRSPAGASLLARTRVLDSGCGPATCRCGRSAGRAAGLAAQPLPAPRPQGAAQVDSAIPSPPA